MTNTESDMDIKRCLLDNYGIDCANEPKEIAVGNTTQKYVIHGK